MTIDCLTYCGPKKWTPTTAEFGLLKIPELSCKPLHDEKVMVWCGFNASTVIKPFFFYYMEMQDSCFEIVGVTGERYADVLLNRIIPSLTDKHLLKSTTFMQDSAPLHVARQDLLRRLFGDDRVLSHRFRYAWFPRSPDLNLCDYCL